ncbi:hypothetical protein BST61_g6455 [Cercospora zeina]
MHVVNLRHPGYADSSNILLTLQAPDDLNGGIHAETLSRSNLIAMRTDEFGHDVIDRRSRTGDQGPWPVVARFADWEWPDDGLPEIWKLAEEDIARQAERVKSGMETTLVDSDDACRLCGRDEETGMCRFWRYDTSGEQRIFEREKSKIGIAGDLRGDGASDADEDEAKSDSESSDGDGKESSDQDLAAHETSTGGEEEEDEQKSENYSGSESSATNESDAESDHDESHGIDDPLDDDRNWLRIGKDCSFEPDHCDVERAFDKYQWLFVPKFEHNEQPILCAHIFGAHEEGITAASHNKPLKLPWKSSIELMFAHFVQAIFEQIEVFFTAGVDRAVRVMDADGTKILMDADAAMCGLLTVPSVIKSWPTEKDDQEDENEGVDSDSDSGSDEPVVEDAADDDAEDDTANESAEDELEERVITSEEFQAHMQELSAMLAETEVEDTGSEIPETVTKRAFPDIGCDVCDQSIFDTRYMCLDCEESPLLASLRERLEARRSNCSSSSDENETNSEEEKNLDSHLAKLLATHIESGAFLQYSESLTDTSPNEARIRILHLWPGEGQTPISGHLETARLSDIFPFEALSYCWGNPEPRRVINISGSRLEVGTNLKLALYRLRLPDKVRRLWIDGICINQGDVHEKTAQVTMMRKIYERAEQTIVWLGEEADDSRLALKMCDRMLNAHGNTYIRQTLGVDVEKLFLRNPDDVGDESEVLDEDKLQQFMTEVGSSFDLDHAMYDQVVKVSVDALAGEAQGGPLDNVVNQALADERTSLEEMASIDWQDIGRRVAQGEEYDGPYKELVYASVAEAMAELKEEEKEGADSEDQDDEERPEVDEHENDTSAATTEQDVAVMKAPPGSKYHHRVILQILRARQQNKDTTAATEPPTSEEIAALYALFERPWFSRIWIVQEAGVSSQILIQCGGQQIDWWAFNFGFLITQKLKRVARLGPKSHRNLVVMSRTRSSIHVGNSMKHMMTTPDPDLSLPSLLSTYRGYEATDPRDKVFALLGIASSQEGLVPDYTKSCEAVYQDVAATLLQQSPHLDLLASCQASPERNANNNNRRPSWVPDWSDLSRKPYKLSGNQNFESSDSSNEPLRVFQASAASTAQVKIQEDNNKLRLQGFIADKISAISSSSLLIDQQDLLMPVEFAKLDKENFPSMIKSITRFFSVLATFPAVIEEWKVFAEIDTDDPGDTSHSASATSTSTSKAQGPDTTTTFTIFARTLWTDLKPPQTCVSDCKEWLERLNSIRKLMQNLPVSFEVETPPPNGEQNLMKLILSLIIPIMQALDPNELRLVHELSCVHTLDRRLARTESGKLCLAPAETKVGDCVGLLQGGRTPFVLRLVAGCSGGDEDEDEDEHVLVGETYVYGMMNGEAWEPGRCREVCLV